MAEPNEQVSRWWPACVGLTLVAAMALGGCSSDKGFKTREVERNDFGTAWPFVADAGILACEPGGVPTFTADGNTVGLDDPDLSRRQWAADATADKAAQMREQALALCD